MTLFTEDSAGSLYIGLSCLRRFITFFMHSCHCSIKYASILITVLDPSVISDNLLLLENGNNGYNFKHVCRFIGSFRVTLRETPTIAVFTRLFFKAKYKVDTVEPYYYGRWGAGGWWGYRKCPYKKFLTGHVIEVNKQTPFGEQLKY